MPSSTTNLFFHLLIICLGLDIMLRYYEKPPVRMTKNKIQKEKPVENKYENPLKDVDIDTSLDEENDDDEFADMRKKKIKKKNKNETEEDTEEDKADKIEKEAEKEQKKEKKKKKKKVKKSEDEEEEEEYKDVLTILYDKKNYQKYYENLKLQILGNFTWLDIEEREYPLPNFKKFFGKITFFTQMGISFLIFGGQKMKDKLTMIPPSFLDLIEKNKWFVLIGNFLFHQWLNKYLSTSGAFEVYYKDIVIYSKLAGNRLPSEPDIHRQLVKYMKKSNKKRKKSKYNDEDDDI